WPTSRATAGALPEPRAIAGTALSLAPARRTDAMNTATYVPPTREQVDTIRRVLVHERDIERAAILLAAATCPSVKIPRLHAAEAATIRAQRPPAHHDLPAALLRITRAI